MYYYKYSKIYSYDSIYEYKGNKPLVIKAAVFFVHISTEVIFVGNKPLVATTTVFLGTTFLGNTAVSMIPITFIILAPRLACLLLSGQRLIANT